MVPSFYLTPGARLDLIEISEYLVKKVGHSVASRASESLFAGFDRLARSPGLGHRREDLAPAQFRFYLVRPYYIVFDPSTVPIQIVRIVHASRNIPKELGEDY